jgi:hypothetical protein
VESIYGVEEDPDRGEIGRFRGEVTVRLRGNGFVDKNAGGAVWVTVEMIVLRRFEVFADVLEEGYFDFFCFEGFYEI